MIIDRRHIHILEVISVILFSVFGGYLVAVDPSFNKNVTVSELIRLLSILISGILLYFCVFKLKEISEEASTDFHSETDLSKKAQMSIDDRYRSYFQLEKSTILLRLTLSSLCFVVFVSLEFWPSHSQFLDLSLYGDSAMVLEPGTAHENDQQSID